MINVLIDGINSFLGHNFPSLVSEMKKSLTKMLGNVKNIPAVPSLSLLSFSIFVFFSMTNVMKIFTVFYPSHSADSYIVVFVYIMSTRGDLKGYYSILELNTYSKRYTSFWELLVLVTSCFPCIS